MKTFYFSGYYEEPWECGDGCCTGGGHHYIDFTHMTDGDKTYDRSCFRFGTCYGKNSVLFSVYEEVYEEDVPSHMYETWDESLARWLTQKLEERGVRVIIEIEGE